MKDDGEAALLREREAVQAEERERAARRFPEIEGTDAARQAFKQKMEAWRRDGGIPGYVGPRAGRDS